MQSTGSPKVTKSPSDGSGMVSKESSLSVISSQENTEMIMRHALERWTRLVRPSFLLMLVQLTTKLKQAIQPLRKGENNKCITSSSRNRTSGECWPSAVVLEFPIKVVNLPESPCMSLRADAPEWKFRLLCYWLFVRRNNLVFALFGCHDLATSGLGPSLVYYPFPRWLNLWLRKAIRRIKDSSM